MKTQLHRQPVAAVRRSQYKTLSLSLTLLFFASLVQAEGYLSNATQPSYIALIEAHTSDELSEILTRLDTLLNSDQAYPLSQPLALVLHGDEVEAFLSRNYASNRELVDLAARLDAFDAVEIQVCETWMRGASVQRSELPAFIETVPYGPAQEKALINQGFEYF